MTKYTLVLGLAGLLSFANADFFNISAGAGFEQQEIKGYIKIHNTINYFNKKSAETDGNPNTGDFRVKTKLNPYVWIKFTHPIPIIPNIKLKYTKYKTYGHSDYIAVGEKTIGNTTVNVAVTNATSNFEVNSYSASLFYKFNPLILKIETGVGIDYWEVHEKVYGTDNIIHTTKTWIDDKWHSTIPYLYANLETTKLFNTSICVNFKFAKKGDLHYYKYDAGLKHTFDISGPIKPNVKIGYRVLDGRGVVNGTKEIVSKCYSPYAELGFKF